MDGPYVANSTLSLLSSLLASRTGSASDWCALQEALYKCIDTIQYRYNTILAYTCIRTYTWIYMCVYIYIYVCVHVGICMTIHAYTYTHK